MATRIWIGNTSGEGNTAANWHDATVPIDEDTIIFNDQSTRSMDSFASITTKDFYVVFEKGFNYSIGTSGTPIAPQTIKTLIFSGSGIASSYVTYASAVGVCYIDTQSTKDTVLQPGGSMADFTLKQGKVALASSTTIGSSFSVIGSAAGGVTDLTIPSSCTITPPANISGGKVTTQSSIATVNIYGGQFIFDGSAVASTRLNVFGGEVIWDSTGTMALIEVYGGVFRTRVTRATRAITTMRVYSGGVADFSSGGWNITYTNAPRIFGTGRIMYPQGFGVSPTI